EAYQHDFAARIDWSNTPKYEDANHPPQIKQDYPGEIQVKSGEKVTLSGAGAQDPDGDKLFYHWFLYKEAGTLNAAGFNLENPNPQDVTFTAPDTDKVKTMHFILEVKDNGEPSLTRYKRIIVNVMP
ncbi:MAG: hypothetical protein KDD63_24405, partial [Bacteroidetes bacterium]|nr:hypothetical protein [Bacteroidota bacterium]